LLSVPEIEIVDERDKNVAEKSYEGGSTIQLKCLVSQIVDEPPEYIIWHHEDRMLNYDTERGGIRYSLRVIVVVNSSKCKHTIDQFF
jgi:hypothetical protein